MHDRRRSRSASGPEVWTDLARIFSTVCNPFLTALAALRHPGGRPLADQHRFLVCCSATATFFTSIGPMLYVFWLYASDRISDLDMSSREEREHVFVRVRDLLSSSARSICG